MNHTISGSSMGSSTVPSGVAYTPSDTAYSDPAGALSTTAVPADEWLKTQRVSQRDLPAPYGNVSTSNRGPRLPQETPRVSFRTRSLYVGDLHEDVGEQVLMELFQGYGPVQSIRICRDMITRVSLGYGYVNFMNNDDAERAMEELNFHCSAKTMRKAIRISWKQRDSSVRVSGRGNIFVKGLDENVGNRELFDAFKPFGRIMSSKVAMDSDGNSLGHGFVHYESAEAAKMAIEKMNGAVLSTTRVFVGPFIPKGERTNSTKESYTNIFVKDIDDRRLTDDKLRDLFGSYGEITSVYVPQRADGSPKGFAFINYTTHHDAKLAVDEMNGRTLDGRIVYVGRAQKRSERDAELLTVHERLRREEEINREGRNLYVENLSPEVNEEVIKQHFGVYGTIESCIVIRDHAGTSRGFGFVCFQNINEAMRAKILLNGSELGPSRNIIRVAMAHCKGNRRSGVRPPAPIHPAYSIPTGWDSPHVGPNSYSARPSISDPRVGTAPAYAMESSNRYVTSGPVPMFNHPDVNPNRMPANHPDTHGNRMHVRGHLNTDAFMRIHGDGDVPSRHAVGPESVAEATPEERKEVLGELVYRKVSAYDADRAGKITGMLLELDVNEVVHMLEAPSALEERVRQAIYLLNDAAQSRVRNVPRYQ